MPTLTVARRMPKRVMSVRPVAKARIRSKPRIERGLCVTCINAQACVFPRDPQRPLLECDEFDGMTPAPVKRFSTELGWRGPGEAQGRHRGLCSNCDHLGSCVYPKPERGVLHCEEYC